MLANRSGHFLLAFSQHSHVVNRYIGNDPKGQTGIIDDFLRTEMGNRFGWHTTGIEVDLTTATYRAWQIRLAMGMLGATAFEVMFGDSTRLPADQIPVSLAGDIESESFEKAAGSIPGSQCVCKPTRKSSAGCCRYQFAFLGDIFAIQNL